MPELPEVETVRRELRPVLTGRTIVGVARLAPAGPKYARIERARGQRIVGVERRGKFLLLPLEGGDRIVIHLGMTGSLALAEPGDHVRVVLELEPPARLFFRDPRRFGRFLLLGAGDTTGLPSLRSMGPEPLDPGFDDAALARALAPSRAPIKSLLLSQRAVAGVGNIYADEALWRARIHPGTAACRIGSAKTRELRRALVAVLVAALDARGTTFRDYRRPGGERGGFAVALAAYGRAGEPCRRRCGARLRRQRIGQRSCTYCPRCQRPA
jgi:formamidopyrimidine-DNA glycosylase